MAKDNGEARAGISIASLLGILFVTLKLCGVIHWSWWWVTVPFWGGPAFLVTVIGIFFTAAGVLAVFEGRR